MAPAILPLASLYLSLSSGLEWGVLLRALLRVVERGTVLLVHPPAPRHASLPLCPGAFPNAERGLPAPGKEPAAGGTASTVTVAKGIVGALCKSKTPTDRSPRVLALSGHAKFYVGSWKGSSAGN